MARFELKLPKWRKRCRSNNYQSLKQVGDAIADEAVLEIAD
jgi:hypothetical protein